MDKSKELKRRSGAKKTDFRLLLDRLEKAIVSGNRIDRCAAVLKREHIWKRLEPDLQIRWAKMAQMAGEIDLALSVLSHINDTAPDVAQAWEERIELLTILERKEELARVIEAAEGLTGKEYHKDRLLSGAGGAGSERADEADELEPFVRMKERQQDIQLFLELFSGREDCFARQWADRGEGKQGYVPVRRPMQPEDVEEHLSGRKTYGIYLLRSDSTVNLAVIDVDVAQKYRNARLSAEDKGILKRERAYLFSRIDDLAKERGLCPVAEFSGSKGYHFWFFFDGPCLAKTARRVIGDISAAIARDLTAFELEVFPKQDSISGKGLGNLVKLPLGVHRLTGKRSYFIECQERAVDAQLRFLRSVKKIPSEKVEDLSCVREQGDLLIHPKMKQWAEKFPELMALEIRCPPLGQLIASCRNRSEPSIKEEKIIYQTIGFLPNARRLLHHIFKSLPDYNQHLVDYKLSRIRGKPLGCKRIHSLMDYGGDFCPFERAHEYAHPLLHLEQWKEDDGPRSEKVENLRSAIENLKVAIAQLEAFLK